MLRIKLYDTLSPDCRSFGSTLPPDDFEWYRGDEPCDIAVYTDNNLRDLPNHKAKHKVNIAWLIESPELFPGPYAYMLKCADGFDAIGTFYVPLLKEKKRAVCVPFGGCWIQNKEKKDFEEAVATKGIMTSMVLSSKTASPLQRMRQEIMRYFPQINYYGLGTPKPLPHLEKHLGISPCYYSIVVENCCEENYFTEKIIDCFACGTIPIYCGCPNIKSYFNGQGILTFQTLDSLENILQLVSVDDYAKRKMAIKENFCRSAAYWVPENLLYDRVIKGYIK